MGLFSSKYTTQVSTTVSRVIEDEALPNAVMAGLLKSHFNDGNLPDYVIEELVTSIGIRAERMYDYAEDNYTHGLPSGEVYSTTQGRAQVEATIESIEGQQVLLDYSQFGPPNALHMGWMSLIANHGYTAHNNQLSILTAQKGAPVYLKDMVVVVPVELFRTLNPFVLASWGTAARAGYTPDRTGIAGSTAIPSPPVSSATATDIHVLVTYVWQPLTPANAPLSTGTFTIDVTTEDETSDYFHAKYKVGTSVKYWMYKNQAGTYPLLDAVFVDGPAESGTYFPITYFRYNKQSQINDPTSEAYLSSKKMLKYLGMDYDLLAESIDANPDIGNVEQAMMVMAVPPSSNEKVECRYLFDYFNELFYAMGSPTTSFKSEWMDVLFGSSNLQEVVSNNESLNGISPELLALLFNLTPAQRQIVIKDSRFKMALSNTGITKNLRTGTIGPVGTYKALRAVTDVPPATLYSSTNAVVTAGGIEPWVVVEDPLTGYLWSLDKTNNNDNVLVWDPATETLIKKIPLNPYFPFGGIHIIYVPTTRSMWVMTASSTGAFNDLIRIDIDSYSIAISNITVGIFINLFWGYYDPINDCVFLGNGNGATNLLLMKVNTSGTPGVPTYTTGWPDRSLWCRQGVPLPNGTMAIRMYRSALMPIIDLATNSVVKVLTTPNYPSTHADNYANTLVYDPVRNRLVYFVGYTYKYTNAGVKSWMCDLNTDTFTELPDLPNASFAEYHADSDCFLVADSFFNSTFPNVGPQRQFRLIDAKDFSVRKVLFNGTSTPRSITISKHNPGYAYFTAANNRVYRQELPSKTYRYQRQASPGVYDEILVDGLKMTYFIYGDYTTTGDEFNDDFLLIPLDRSITRRYSIPVRELLYARSLHFVFNSRVVTEIKWYQRGIFKALLLIVAIVITIFTYGADGGSAIAVALGLTGTAGLIATIVVTLAIGQLLAYGFKLFVKAFGTEVATAIAVLAIIYGGYQVIQAGGVAGAPWAQTLLQISSGLQQAVLQDKYQDLLSQADQFNLFVEDQTEMLEKAQELLQQSTVLSPFVIFGEKPEDFYNRTVHSGNIGILGINAISSYVDIALTLPKLNDTVGEEIYGQF
jgi:hypothetical protein